MTANQVQDLEEELSTCDGQIREISQLRPDSILAQLRQGLRASKQELQTLADYLESLKRHREVTIRFLECSRSSFKGNSAARSA
jgi:hypothetical protein